METYFIFTKYPHGIHVDIISKDVMEQRVLDDFYKNYKIYNDVPKPTTNYWNDNDMLIIKGTQITTTTKINI